MPCELDEVAFSRLKEERQRDGQDDRGDLDFEDDRHGEEVSLDLPEIELPVDQFTRTDAVNQIPTVVAVSRNGRYEERLGAQSYESLIDLVNGMLTRR